MSIESEGAGAGRVREISPERIEMPDGRGLVTWRNEPEGGDRERRVAVVAPGFARRMRHVAGLARALVDNGVTVYRCDYIDHVGLSDGQIWDFTLTGMYDSLRALVANVRDVEGLDTELVVVASSLGARPALRLAARHPDGIAGLVNVVGVVDTRYTLRRVFEDDLSRYPAEHWGPADYVEFEGKRINALRFRKSWLEDGWLDTAETEREITAVSCPIVNYCGSSDDWVEVAEVKRIYGVGGSGARRVVELPFVEHDLARNPVAAQTVLREVTRSTLTYVGAGTDDIAETSFLDLAVQLPYERRFEAECAALVG